MLGCVCPDAHKPASAKENNAMVDVSDSNSPILPGIRKAAYINTITSGIVDPNPVRSAMLMGRMRLGERFTKIRIKTAIDMTILMVRQK